MGDVSALTPLEALRDRVGTLLGDKIIEQTIAFNELTVRVHRETILECARLLHDDQ